MVSVVGMGRAARVGVFALVAIAPAVVANCGHAGAGAVARTTATVQERTTTPEPTGAPVTTGSETQSARAPDGGPCGGPANGNGHEDEKAPDDGISPALERFTSRDEIVEMMHAMQKARPANGAAEGAIGSGSGGGESMWGDAIGDAFGAGGLGLSGIGEGGGGVGANVQEFGMIGLITGAPASGNGTGNGMGAGRGGAAGESITNNQHAAVDEGGIVKVHGDHLVVLRRGRLFTVRADDLAPVAAVDAFAPGTDPSGAWYDEMLVSGDTIAVIGYSYARGGTEIGLFDIDAAGRVRARSTYHLRSNDYYSSRNYASRLVGDKLVFYTPLYVRTRGGAGASAGASGNTANELEWMPAMRRWRAGARAADFQTIAAATSLYKPLHAPRAHEMLALHTVTTCDLSNRAAMTCTARGVLAGAGRSFYVSPDAVYVWTTRWDGGRVAPSLVYRLPLDEHAEPGVIRAAGAPIDQLSFLERDGHLNVLVRPQGKGDAMWAPELTTAAVALVRVPLGAFTKQPRLAPSTAYARLPAPDAGALQNRFVGDHLVYGTGLGWGRPKDLAEQKVFVTRYSESGAPTFTLPVGHAVDRIEALGDDAIAIGPDKESLHFTSIALGSPRGGAAAKQDAPRIASRFTRAGATQGELRTHGFFYRSDGDREGYVGLPIRAAGSSGFMHVGQDSAKILFVKNEGLDLREVGSLASSGPAKLRDDRCVASCVDWYGNARPIFFRGRVLALLGYELVEGRIEGAAPLAEMRRASFAPRR